MRVFVAGASGTIGSRLVPRLRERGHEVTGTTRSPERADEIRAAGAEAVICDVFDAEALKRAVMGAMPDVVVNELTSLSKDYDPRKLSESFYAPTNRVRTEGGSNLLAAAQASMAKRFVTQSIAFLYAPEGPMVVAEDAKPATEAAPPIGDGVRAMVAHETAALEAEGLDALVLRYGWFYGPGTHFAPDGSIAEIVRRRRFPVISGSDGRFSFIHIEDASAATVAACEGGSPGIYNITDDEPAAVPDWLPVYAEALGAKPPWKIPRFVARLFGGGAARMAMGMRGASNAKAKRELDWTPRYPSWRTGFREALG